MRVQFFFLLSLPASPFILNSPIPLKRSFHHAEQGEDKNSSPTSFHAELGDDKNSSPKAPLLTNDELTAKLRKSLADSSTFKIKNDARFTWATISVLSFFYAYCCVDASLTGQLIDLPDTTASNHNDQILVEDYMRLFNIPNLGLPGAGISLVLGTLSAKLFIDPFRKELSKARSTKK